jgi:hypothetical protein
MTSDREVGRASEGSGGARINRSETSTADAGPAQAADPLVERLLSLQRTAGNRAVGALLQRDETGRRMLLRLVVPPKTAAQLDAEIDVAIAAGDWAAAALSLNGFNDDDIAKRVGTDPRLTPKRRELMAGALQSMILWPPPQRVADAIYAADGPAARLGRIDFIKAAVARSDWQRAVLALNGLSADDIDKVLADELPRGSTLSLWQAADTYMKGWEGHVVPSFQRIDPPFRNAGIKAAYNANRAAGSLEQLRALWVLDGPQTGPWANLRWDTVAAAAAVRVYHPELIDQATLGLCGPAAALNADAQQHATKYARLVVEIFAEGKADGERINKTLLGNRPVAGMDPCDWMVLSGMQDVLNSWYDYYGEYFPPPSEDKRAGLTDSREEKALRRFSGCVETDTWDDRNAAFKVEYLLKNHADESVVVMVVDSEVLQGRKAQGHSDHFIRVLTPVYNNAAGMVYFDAFTWGQKQTYTFTQANFKDLWYGYVVGSTRKGLLSVARHAGP